MDGVDSQNSLAIVLSAKTVVMALEPKTPARHKEAVRLCRKGVQITSRKEEEKHEEKVAISHDLSACNSSRKDFGSKASKLSESLKMLYHKSCKDASYQPISLRADTEEKNMCVSKKALVSWEKVCKPKDARGLNMFHLDIWNKPTILKHL
ncbi:hypothetical protein H5410_015479 [Solanum commersonii]|uniref:Uncharacterized protein n=1 Tax=Solanum commersonii TaxID=4109 RepID=A0A9J5ZUM4_SOLCO|nr:hypothetical protein H5410_015479 [Solanum commersonii]